MGDRDFEGSIHLTDPVHGGRDGVGRQLGEGIPELKGPFEVISFIL